MRVLQINNTDMFSTGNIMLNIANAATERGNETWTISKYTRTSTLQNKRNLNHIYVGNRVEHTIHRYFSWITDLQDFGSNIATYKIIRIIKKINPDIIHLHDLVGWYVNIGLLFNYLKKINKPIVWTFHDCWAFTGRCIYFDAIGCNNWRKGCGNCPQLDYMPKSWFFDNSAFNWNRKRRLFTSCDNITIVTPSEWLKELTRKSFLNKYRCVVINNGINLNVFKPTYGKTYHKLKKDNSKIILGVASTWSKRKGLDDFIRLSNELPDGYKIIIVGLEQTETNNERICAIKRTTNQEELAEIYTAADVFVNPTTEDNFPTVNLEALACGTPIVTYRTGGSPECVNEKNGLIVEKGNYGALKAAIYKILERNKGAYTEACIEKAKEYDMNERFNDYVNLYEEILNR
ncbi:MAG: glycosyltransferase [Bacteroidaceae bacterium]|nr:glycosyltransferase [Bacteroidaceae bacterium]